jgi:PKHD-type hydroxylase
MANYIFTPSPNFGISEHPFVTWRGGFTDDELVKITEICEKFPVEAGQAVGYEDSKDIRSSQVSWITQTAETSWIYDKLSWIAKQLNGEFYKFDIYGFAEDFQYTVYDKKCDGHYTWHRDSGDMSNGTPPRKLSLILQLSDPEEYQGGQLEVYTGVAPQEIKKEKGLISLFPSYVLHRVTPITSGIRKTLVVWICGPSFR